MAYAGITAYIGTLVYFALAGIINFSLQSSTFSTVFFVLLATGFFESILNLLLGLNFVDSILGWIRPYLIESVLADTMMAFNGVGSLATPLLVIGAYLLGSLIISSFLFHKVELEF